MAGINLANSRTKKDGKTLTELLAKRDYLRLRLKVLRGFVAEASETVSRHSKSEIAILSSVDVAAVQKEVDSYAKELRTLDETIQELNWTMEF